MRVHSKPIFHLLGRGCVLQRSSVHPWGHRQEIDELHELLNQSRAGSAHPGGAGNPNYPAELKLPPKRRPVRLGHQVWPPSLSLAQLRWDPENPMAVEGAAPSCLQFPIFWSRLLFAFGVRAISLGEQMQGGVLPTAPLPKPSLVGVRVDHPPTMHFFRLQVHVLEFMFVSPRVRTACAVPSFPALRQAPWGGPSSGTGAAGEGRGRRLGRRWPWPAGQRRRPSPGHGCPPPPGLTGALRASG